MKSEQWQNSRAGFTLVEMVAVVLIISLLLGVSSTAISGARRTAMRTHSLDTVRQLAAAWNAYVTDQGSFPDKENLAGGSNDMYPATPDNIGKRLNTQYRNDGKTPLSKSIVYFETSEAEVERSGSSPNYSYKGTGVVDRWKNVVYFTLDFDLVGKVNNPVTGQEVASEALALSTAGFGLGQMRDYGKKFLVAW